MSIDKRILWKLLEKFIVKYYKGEDIEVLLWLTHKVVMHYPQLKCKRKCPKSEWNGLAPNKSLFNQDIYHGLAIGNLSSQMFANFLLKFVVDFLYTNGVKFVIQYVDDFFCIIEEDTDISILIPNLREFLLRLNLRLHPRKCYIQHISKGVKFLGFTINPYRRYISGRVQNEALLNTYKLSKSNLDIETILQTVNSHLGHLLYSNSYKIREKLCSTIIKTRKCYCTTNCNIVYSFRKEKYKTKVVKKIYNKRKHVRITNIKEKINRTEES